MDVAGKSTDELISQKVEKVKAGYSVFVESTELIEKIRNLLAENDIQVHEDQTDQGSWFIPVNKKE
ncbi:hypothetical protein [Bacillus piscicola]|uniref:hypothetical protein n=1 Tax=Bacillus piscicola TaxID=1632684 RepID=UPI001F09C27A|nr:hypothetical protein [Bacillus piscicola]